MLRRITLLAAGAALLAVALYAVPLGVFAARGYLNDERLELQRAATSTAASLRGELDGAAARTLTPPELDVTLYDAAGRRGSGPGPARADRTVRIALQGRESTATGNDRILVAAPVSDGDKTTGAVLLSTSLVPVHDRTVRAWLTLAGMGLLAVVLAGAIALVIARRLTGPIDRLTETARRIGEGDLDSRATPSGVLEIDVLAATLNASTERIGSMLARERRLSAEVSHQLRTPLTGLRLELETARAEAGDGAGLDRALAVLDRLDVTITEVITLARELPAGQVVNLENVLLDAQRRWHGVLAAVSRPLRIDADIGAPSSAAMSPAAAGQIIDVLVDNARAHGRGAVTIAVRRTGSAVAIDVRDEGAAVVAEAHELFRRRPGPDGHGLGLAFARRLAEAEGARLVLSQPGPPTFSLLIPSTDSTSEPD